MTKSNQIFETKKIIGIILLFFIYIISNAQQKPAIAKSTTLFKDANIGYFIIGGILGFGIIGYIAISIIEKYRPKSNKDPVKVVNINHNKHRHHKVVKKSA